MAERDPILRALSRRGLDVSPRRLEIFGLALAADIALVTVGNIPYLGKAAPLVADIIDDNLNELMARRFTPREEEIWSKRTRLLPETAAVLETFYAHDFRS